MLIYVSEINRDVNKNVSAKSICHGLISSAVTAISHLVDMKLYHDCVNLQHKLAFG